MQSLPFRNLTHGPKSFGTPLLYAVCSLYFLLIIFFFRETAQNNAQSSSKQLKRDTNNEMATKMHAYSSEMATADMHADNREAAPVVVSQKQRIIRIVPKETVIPKEIPISGIFSSHPSPQKVSVDQTDAPPELESIQFIKYWLEKVETENIGVNYDMGTEMRAENNETATEDMYADMSEFSERDGGIVLDLSTQSNRHAASNEDTRQSLHKNLLDSDDDLETNSASEYQPDGESEDSDSTGASVRRAARQSTDVQGELISLLPVSEVSIASVERQEILDVEEPAFVTKKEDKSLRKKEKAN